KLQIALMADFLVLRFRAGATDHVEWVTVDSTGAIIGEPGYGDAMMAAEAVGDSKVIVLIPGAGVLRTTADIPVRGAAKILQALPFAMEDQLATDVDELHFSVGKRDANDQLPVAIIERLEIEACLELFAAAGIEPTFVYADSDAVSAIPNTTTLFIDGDTLTLRDADGSIAIADLGDAETMLDLWFRAREASVAEAEAAQPINLLVYVTEDAQADAQTDALLAGLQPRVASFDIRILSDGALPRLASQIVTEPGINLLQGRYAVRSNLGIFWPAWRGAAALAACLVLLLVGVKIFEITSLNRQAANLDTAIEQAIRYTFPEVTEVRDARALLQSKLRGLGRADVGGSTTEFLDTLVIIAGAVAGKTNIEARLETINYRSGVMELRVTAPDVEALDSIQKEIVRDGSLEAEIQSANPEGEMVRGRIQVRRPEA
ncbi:MAG: type II secretion system protein GspL, partial [Gammaproteobacteria bacterium]